MACPSPLRVRNEKEHLLLLIGLKNNPCLSIVNVSLYNELIFTALYFQNMFSLALVAFISFVAGVLTILAPCVLPVLPVILAGSLSEKKKWYPYVVTFSLAFSIVLFTLLLKVSTLFIDIPQSFWKNFSGMILVFL